MLGRFLLRGMMVAGVAIAASASAQSGPGTAPVATAPSVDGRAAVAEIRRVLGANYVLPEMRPKLDAVLAQGLAAGRYDVADPAQLVDRVNADLAAVAHDKHLGLHYAPDQAARLTAQGRQTDDGPADPEQVRSAQRRNFGLVEMKVLPGDIRYLDMDGFAWTGPESAAAFDVAMRFLSGGGAAIIDLRHNGGGSPQAVQYLVSHFLPPATPLTTFYMAGAGPSHLETLGELPAGRMIGKPLYVLTSGRTASAAEAFAGHVAGYRLGELIGERTAGAGYRNTLFPIPGGFMMSVSVGRAILASTGKDWEGVGIAPTTAVPADKALDTARLHAMRRLAETAPPPAKRQLEAMAEVLAAELDPVAPALPLAAYAGSFGDRQVRAEEGALTWQRGGGPKVKMVAVGPNRFAFEEDPMTRVEFKVAGDTVASLDVVRGDGSRETETRRP